ncbi:MAG TPA: FtsX-like permease family protein [Vicinamibacterales bacterium]|nr:FtsX-like permease family protein [Vicinamibacterales bacterium]
MLAAVRAGRAVSFYLVTIARLAPGMEPETAAAGLTTAVAPVLQSLSAVEPYWRYGLRPLKDALVGDVRQTLLVLLGTVALVLLIAIVNLGNLMLARSSVHVRKLAVRASLGAGRGRLARHLLAESGLLGAMGGALGVELAWVFLHVGGVPARRVVPRLEVVQPDAGMVAFALVCGIGAGLAAGLLPAARLAGSLTAASTPCARRGSIPRLYCATSDL